VDLVTLVSAEATLSLARDTARCRRPWRESREIPR